jgi:cobalt-zinc-cadmium efflux system membrane fusion protein
MYKLFFFIVLAALAPATMAGDRLIPISPAQRAALGIVTAPLAANTGPVTVGLPATVAVPPEQQRVVSAPVPGLITEVRVAAGDTVRAGQVLAVMRGNDVAQAQQAAARAAVELKLAEESLRRDEALFREGIIPESRLQAARANLAQARGASNAQRAGLRLLGLTGADIKAVERGERLVDHVVLSSPLAGVVTEQMATVGARVDATAPLFRVVRLDPLWLEIQAPAEVAELVRPGQEVGVPGTAAVGRVVSVGRNVSAAQTVTVRARVNNAEGLLRLNQNVSARIEGVAGAKQWHVPVSAVVRAKGGTWVFVDVRGGFEPMPVKVLGQSAQSVALDGPFKGDEQVAAEGVAALKAAWLGMGGE